MAPIKMPFEMRNLTTFPIERLCFDLKLEVLEQLDAKDVIELVKVNQGFQRMISSRPWIAFGHHVDEIEFGFDPHGIEAINIKKLNSESRGVSLDVIRHLPFIKHIRSCNKLCMGENYDCPIDKDHAAFLKQLEAVNSLYLKECSSEHLALLFHLSSKVKRLAELPDFLRKAPSIKDLVGHFIETQLDECKIVGVYCWDDHEFEFYYNALIKTHIESVVIACWNVYMMLPAIQRVVSHGIPSKNTAAVVRVCGYFLDDMKATIVVFLEEYPGMKQINGENRQPCVALANDRLKVRGHPTWMQQALFFRRNINATRDCIYMLCSLEIEADSYTYCFAFYIKPDETIDH